MIANIERLLLIFFFKYQLTFFSSRWRLSAERIRPAKAMINKSDLCQNKNNTNKATIYFKQGDRYKTLKIFLRKHETDRFIYLIIAWITRLRPGFCEKLNESVTTPPPPFPLPSPSPPHPIPSQVPSTPKSKNQKNIH